MGSVSTDQLTEILYSMYKLILVFCLPAAGLAQLEDKHLANLFNGLALVVPKKKKKEK